MKVVRQQRGAALVSVLVLAALLLPMGAWMAMQARMNGAVARYLRADLHAFYIADAGLNHALAALRRLPSAAAAMAGPDGAPGTADDGGVVGAPGARIAFPAVPYGYTLEVQALGVDGVRVRSVGVGWDGTSKQLEAVVFWRNGQMTSWWREIL